MSVTRGQPTAGAIGFSHINAFVEGAVRTFENMCDLRTERDGDLRVRHGMFDTYDMVGMIGISGTVRGAVMLSMPLLTAKRLVSQFLGEPVRETGPVLMDAYGELINIIAGAASASMAEMENGSVQISLPAVFIGKNLRTSASSSRPWIVIPMKLDSWGQFNIEISKEGV